MPQRSLLPVPVTNNGPTDHSSPQQKAMTGAGLQHDGFNLFVGRVLFWLGVVGNILEICTSTIAILITFMDNPGSYDPSFWVKAGFSLFIALCVQAAMWTLVVNLTDSWIYIFDGQFEKAFVSQGEIQRTFFLLYLFEFAGVIINIWWDVVFLNTIAPVGYLDTLGTAILILSSILFVPLGKKLIRNAKRRIRITKQAAESIRRQARAAINVTPVNQPPRGLIQPSSLDLDE